MHFFFASDNEELTNVAAAKMLLHEQTHLTFSSENVKITFALFSVFQGDTASQNMMRSVARQVCEQLVSSKPPQPPPLYEFANGFVHVKNENV